MKKGIWGKRVISTVCAAAMMTAGLPAVALATERDTADKAQIPTTAQNTNGYVTGVCLDAPRDMATLELLGVSSINDAQGNNDTPGYGTDVTPVEGTAWDKSYSAYDGNWAHTQYWLFASGYNENSNPFWVNRGIGATISDDQKGVVAGKLMGSLAAYGDDETSTAVWDMMPNIFMASTAKSLESLESITPDGTDDPKFEGYTPLTAANTLDNFTSYIAGMKAVATAADTAAKGSDGVAGTDDDLTLRYGSATAIANKMQQWLIGTQGYILMKLEETGQSKKTIAVLGSDSSQGGGGGQKGGPRTSSLSANDTETTWTLSNTYNEAYEGIVTADASYDGVVLPESIANNLATTLGKTTVTTEELAQADLIIANSSDALDKLIAAGLGDKAYYGGTNSGVIHSAANAELFQQLPRVLPCLYSDWLDQSDYMAYMYDEFYHLNGGDLLYEACVNLFGYGDGVANWDATDADGDGQISATEKMTWTTSDFKGYNAKNVEKIYTEGWNYLQNTKIDISGATVSAISQQTYTGKAITPEFTVTLDGMVLVADTDYTVTYENNTNAGTATITITGINSYSGTVKASFTISDTLTRLAGENAYGTMTQIVNSGWTSADTVVLASFDGYWDALSASSLAGVSEAPVLYTSPTELSAQSSELITKLGAKNVIIMGGTSAISADVEAAVSNLSGVKNVKRVWGADAAATAVESAKASDQGTARTFVIATAGGYWDALAAGSLSYASNAPILLSNITAEGRATMLDSNTIAYLTEQAKAGMVKDFVIVGGTAAVSSQVETQLATIDNNLKVTRLAGANAVETSNAIATSCIKSGTLTANNLGVATVSGYWDALAGAALCGKRGSVVLLADSSNAAAAASGVITTYKNEIEFIDVFGGKSAVSNDVTAAIDEALKAQVS